MKDSLQAKAKRYANAANEFAEPAANTALAAEVFGPRLLSWGRAAIPVGVLGALKIGNAGEELYHKGKNRLDELINDRSALTKLWNRTTESARAEKNNALEFAYPYIEAGHDKLKEWGDKLDNYLDNYFPNAQKNIGKIKSGEFWDKGTNVIGNLYDKTKDIVTGASPAESTLHDVNNAITTSGINSKWNLEHLKQNLSGAAKAWNESPVLKYGTLGLLGAGLGYGAYKLWKNNQKPQTPYSKPKKWITTKTGKKIPIYE